MGNLIPRVAGGKVIFSDGSVVQELNMEQPVTVAELMLDHPQHLVAEFNKAKANRPVPLPADQTLHADKVYVMIPLVKKNKVSAASANRTTLTKSVFLSCSTWMCRTTTTGIGVGKRGRRRMRRECALDEVEEKKSGLSSSSLLLLEGLNHERPEYFNTQIPAKGWKPTLGTITESTVKAKIPHWLF